LDYQITNIIKTDRVIIKRLQYKEIAVADIKTDFFTELEQERYSTFISDKRRREFYYTRILLRSFNLDLNIVYRPSGKPIINKGHLSISHSRNTVIVAYSETYLIGVDIEFYNPKIHRIKNKFLARSEKETFDTQNEEVLTLLWSIKEAVYKLEDIPGLLFREHIVVQALSHRGKVTVIKNEVEHNYLFDYLIFKDFLITYCYLIA
jgi:4'-phosphopantetheinyl transferase